MKLNDRSAQLLTLLLGVVLLGLSQVRFGVDLLAWVAPVPFLVYLKRTHGWRSRLLFIGALAVAWSAATAKYIVPPLPYFFILLNGVTYSIVSGVGYLAWDRLSRGVRSHLGNLAFAGIMVALEWLQYTFTPLSSNGAAAYTQLENLAFLQVTSLFGIAGISALMYFFAAVVADALMERRIPKVQFGVVISLIVVLHIWGAYRIGASPKAETVLVAAVVTDSTWFNDPLPDDEERQRIEDALFRNSNRAADAGAQLIVWNEVSNFVAPDKESAVVARASEFTKKNGVYLVMAYLVIKRKDPFLVENKYVLVGPKGNQLGEYLKHKPVPGEPSVPGNGDTEVIDTAFGKISGVICYDFDFPQLGLDLAKKDVDIAFIPSSDTVGVDPFHTQIAAIRAIEGGYSVVRSTRMGLSAGIDQYGRMRGWLSSNETDERVLLVSLPTKSVWTFYSEVGDILAYLSMMYLLGLFGWRLFRFRKTRSPS